MEAVNELDEDDIHICLKCRSTIIGLENYIAHRKSSCTKVSSSHADTTTVPDTSNEQSDINPQADHFFSSLELQSSAKKSSDVSSSNTARKIPLLLGYTSGDQRRTDREDLEHDSETQHLTRTSSDSLNIPGESLAEHNTLDHYAGDDDSNDELPEVYDDLEEDDEHQGNYPPRSYTGGKWKPGHMLTSHNSWGTFIGECHGDTSPPPHHTGGKWKPSPPTQTVVSHSDQPQQQTSHDIRGSQSDDEYDMREPPPGYTKGKWLPIRHTRSESEQTVAPIRKSGSTVQYWCGPCHRRLSSRLLYEKHLKSELHFKRTLFESELTDETSIPKSTATRVAGKRHIKRTQTYLDSELWKKKNIKSKIFTKSVQKKTKKLHLKFSESHCDICKTDVSAHLMGKHLVSLYHCRKAKSSSTRIQNDVILKFMQSIVQQAPFQCGPCKFYCNTAYDFLEHWKDSQHIASTEMIPGSYWCSLCDFETEGRDTMEDHLNSEGHNELITIIHRSVPVVIKKRNLVACGSCNKKFLFNLQLQKHLQDTGHKNSTDCTASDEYQNRHRCKSCSYISHTVKSLQKHEAVSHPTNVEDKNIRGQSGENIKEAVKYVEYFEHRHKPKTEVKTCKHCGAMFQNVQLLKDHIRLEHSHYLYRCPKCDATFALPQEVTHHVRKKVCKIEMERKKAKEVTENEPSPSKTETTKTESEVTKKCSLCSYTSESQAELLFHEALHRDDLMLKKDTYGGEQETVKIRCVKCGNYYRKSSLLTHLRTHTKERPFPCGVCTGRFVSRSSLIVHMKVAHRRLYPFIRSGDTGEDLILGDNKCDQCSFTSPNKFSLDRHKLVHTQRNKSFLCSICGSGFYNRHYLKQHMKIHSDKEFKCDQDGCIFECRSRAELLTHMKIHSEERTFSCDCCSYSAKTKAQLVRHQLIHAGKRPHKCQYCSFSSRIASHMTRHMRCHTGARPYKCPYCPHTSNILENLRKHVLTTKKHPGKSMYECKFCTTDEARFSSNLAKDFKVHLFTVHKDIFPTSKMATSYVVGIYDAIEDPRHVDNPLPVRKRRKRTQDIVVHPEEVADNPEQCAAGNQDTTYGHLFSSEVYSQQFHPDVCGQQFPSEIYVETELGEQIAPDNVIYIELCSSSNDVNPKGIECQDVELSLPQHSPVLVVGDTEETGGQTELQKNTENIDSHNQEPTTPTTTNIAPETQ